MLEPRYCLVCKGKYKTKAPRQKICSKPTCRKKWYSGQVVEWKKNNRERYLEIRRASRKRVYWHYHYSAPNPYGYVIPKTNALDLANPIGLKLQPPKRTGRKPLPPHTLAKLLSLTPEQMSMDDHRLKGFYLQAKKTMPEAEAWEAAKAQLKALSKQKNFFPTFDKNTMHKIRDWKPRTIVEW